MNIRGVILWLSWLTISVLLIIYSDVLSSIIDPTVLIIISSISIILWAVVTGAVVYLRVKFGAAYASESAIKTAVKTAAKAASNHMHSISSFKKIK